ncbi:MAG: sugar phosphate nucleotidyltransferase [bacterium]|nr:sugar phosphate nucleotidyltransferase [bacterium]
MNKKPTLLILAAGMGSRYGGLKQIDSVGPSGETIMDYSIYDAIRAGFDKVVFIIRKDFEEAFREKIVAKYEGKIKIELAFQDPLDLPAGCTFPEGREKPWGTAHAIRSARNVIDAPFAAINADDFYGTDAFMQLGKVLANIDCAAEPKQFAMVGYRLDQTLSENGSVARGICEVADDGKLIGVTEMTKIVQKADGTIQNEEDPENPNPLKGDCRVSLNLWGFTPALFDGMEERFTTWFKEHEGQLKAEWYIPFYVDELVKAGKATVDVIPTNSCWFGVTYREDKPVVVEAIQKMVDEGVYPAKLW